MLVAILFAVSLQGKAQALDRSADYLQYLPMATAVGLEWCGVQARHPLRERIAMTATAYATLTAVAGGLKLAVSETRPDGSDDRSFPSGHAARAFMGAELVRTEYGWGWGTGAYALAAAVGTLRITGDHHHFHDVVAGAAVGVLSARLACWVLPMERRLFGWEETTVISALPTYDHNTRTVGFMLTATLR